MYKRKHYLAVALVTALTLLATLVGACAPSATVATPTAAKPAATPTTAAAAASPTKPAAAPTTAPAATAQPKASPAATTAALDQPLSPPVSIKLGILPIFSALNIWTGIEKGFFKEQGINLELVNFNSASEMTAPLATGQLQVGAGSTSGGFFNALERGLPIKIIADWNSAASPSTLWLVIRKDLADSGAIKDYADWKGKTVAINAPGTFSEIVIDMGLKKGGLTKKDINLVNIGFDQVGLAMSNKSIDIALANEPTLTVAVQQGFEVKWKDINELDPGREYSVILLSPIFAKDNPEAAKRWALAYLKSIRYYQNALKSPEGKKELIEILGKYMKVADPSLYDKVVFPSTNPDGYVNDKSVRSDYDWYVAEGLTKQQIDLSMVIDNQYMDYAISKLGKATR